MKLILLITSLFLTMTANALTKDSIIAIEQVGEKSTLKRPAKKVTFPLSPSDKKLISEMQALLYELDGVGLAAPQVNQDKAIIAIYITSIMDKEFVKLE